MKSLLNFLKKYSDIDAGFIEEFLDIREGDKTHDPFRVDLDIVTKWLKTDKDNLKKTLEISSYSPLRGFIRKIEEFHEISYF